MFCFYCKDTSSWAKADIFNNIKGGYLNVYYNFSWISMRGKRILLVIQILEEDRVKRMGMLG